MIITNELPRIVDVSRALAGRMIILRLTESFFRREDPDLTDKLLREFAGILLWSIEGWQRLREKGHFQQPGSAIELLDELADLASPVAMFVRERCVVGGQYCMSVELIYREWCSWCGSNGRREPGTNLP